MVSVELCQFIVYESCPDEVFPLEFDKGSYFLDHNSVIPHEFP